ncbi:MAG TPA: helix-turn-helix domain-containing protein [Micromonosporaceae bacterium]
MGLELSGATLRAIAHPLRVRLLSLLREEGPSTASKLADMVGESSGVTSYHLRQLAKHGFVAEDESLGTGRDRWWRAVVREMSLDSPAVRESMADAETYMRAVAIQDSERVDRWLRERSAMPPAWDAAAHMGTHGLRLTAEEAARVTAEFNRIVAELRPDRPDEDYPDGAERVVVQFQIMPFVRGGE